MGDDFDHGFVVGIFTILTVHGFWLLMSGGFRDWSNQVRTDQVVHQGS